MINLSPYGHISQLPVEGMDYMKASLLTIIAVILTVVGFIGYNKQDIEG